MNADLEVSDLRVGRVLHALAEVLEFFDFLVGFLLLVRRTIGDEELIDSEIVETVESWAVESWGPVES